MLTTEDFIKKLEQLEDPAERLRLIESEAAGLTEERVQQMKARANDLLHSEPSRGLTLADNIIYASQVSGKPVYRALGLMVQANSLMHRGEQRQAIALYDEARQVALAAGNPVEAARSQVGKIGALMRLGEYQQAIVIAQQTGDALVSYGELVSGASAYMTGGLCYAQLEQSQKALSEYQKAETLLERAGTINAEKQLRFVLHNTAIALRDLGRYHEAVNYSLRTCDIADKYNLIIDKANFQQCMATCYYLMGNYNKALRLLHNARKIFEENNHYPDLIDCEYFMCNCYMELGRYEEVVEQAKTLLELVKKNGPLVNLHSAITNHTLGRALIALNQFDQAHQTLLEAQYIAEQLGAIDFKQRTDLRLAELYIARNEPEEAKKLLNHILLHSNDVTLKPFAQLLLARIEATQTNLASSNEFALQAIQDFENLGIQNGIYQGYYQLAENSERQGHLTNALTYLNQSIEKLEHLRGHISSESRSAFLRSKETVYEAAIALSLETGQIEKAFHLAERVKSRALVELVGNQLDIRVRIRDEADQPLVEEIEQLRLRHNNLTRRLAGWQTRTDSTSPDEGLLSESERQDFLLQTLECERRLTELTERLQVRNAHYAEDISLTPTYQPFDPAILQPDEALVEYYIARGEVLALVVEQSGVQVVRKLTDLVQLNRLLAFFRLNLAGTVKSLADCSQMAPETFAIRMDSLIANSRALLQKLYTALFAPLEPLLANYKRLLIVPHGSLHYLPFHALYNAKTGQYLLEAFDEISYLPAANLLRFCRERAGQSTGKGALVFGYSNQGALPCTQEEAQLVAATLRGWGECVEEVEEAASLERFRAEAHNKRIIHLAAHGRYREDAPLFSSLLLAGGELTGHEIFNMELQASLVTLSACDSGLGTIGGGDEILGLSRACLYAGASSLALSLWRVEDRAGSRLMQEFYRNLLNGQSKAAALRQAQLALLNHPDYRHPFYWAPFILIGDGSPL